MDANGLYNRTAFVGSRIPVVGSVFQAVDSYNYMNDYMKNHPNVTWENMKYPSMKTGSGAIGYAGSMVSKNILTLYKD